MKNKMLWMLCGLFLTPSFSYASPASDALFAQYKAEGAGKADPARGKANWAKEVKSESGEMKSCAKCHTTDLTVAGRHIKTKKAIEPMAPRVNNKRFIDAKEVDKWFKRNCKDTWGRECTAQEKSDFVAFFFAQ